MMNKIKITAPARICLFGDHQDYLELPVIACAIDRQIELNAEASEDDMFHILMPDIEQERHISIYEIFETLNPHDFMASALRVVRRYGCIPNQGYTIRLTSNIPINAGVSSSSALVVVWVHFLLKAFGYNQDITPSFIAQLAYEAEVVEHHSPGGKMDQFTSAIGDIIYMETDQNSVFRTIGTSMDGLILAESGVPKNTIGSLSHARQNAMKAIETVLKKIPDFKLNTAKIQDYEELSTHIPENLKPFLYAAIKNHSITQRALTLFERGPLDMKIIGELMSQHHNVLKDQLKITVPKIDCMIDAAIGAGAYGAKIVGSGNGGSIVALAPPNREAFIINEILKSGAKAAYKVSVTGGTHSI